MSANFDWQTEEDERRAQDNIWDDEPQLSGDRPPRRRLPWRLVTVVGVLVALVGALIWWRIDKQVEATLAAFRTDVIASHNLVQRAVAENDEEIFRSVLSGRVPAWTAAEMEVFGEQLMFDRTPLGLSPTEGSLPVILTAGDEETPAGERPVTIDFSPDLNEATVTVAQSYRVDATNETIVLRQTTVFRRGDSRWLLAPPLDEFWGEWVTNEGDYLSLIYPRRDEDIAGRLAEDIDRQIAEMCATLEDINCSADLHLTARLDYDPTTLAALGQPLGALQRAREREDILELPTPTLVGLPPEDGEQSEAAYQALAAGYARHLVGAAIAQSIGWRFWDSPRPRLFEMFVDYQLGELGITSWPIGPADYQHVLDKNIRLTDIGRFARTRRPDDLPAEQLRELQTTIDFLANGLPGVSAADAERIMNRNNSFDLFMEQVFSAADAEGGEVMPRNPDMAFWLFAFRQATASSDTPPASPSESLYLSCTAVDGNQATDTSNLLQYDPAGGTWTEKYSLPGFIWMSALPNPQTLLMQEFAVADELWRTNVWRDGGLVPAFVARDGRYAISFGETDPQGRFMVAYTFDPQSDTAHNFLLDLADCPDGCATTELEGRPVWSPNGRQAIYMGDSQSFPDGSFVSAGSRYIFLQSSEEMRDVSLALGPGDAAGGASSLTSLGNGRSPFWLDERTYGYVRRIATDGPAALGDDEIVLATVDEPVPFRVIPAADLYQFLPEDATARRFSIGYVATHPLQPDKLFVVVMDPVDMRAYVIIYDLETQRPETRLNLYYHLNHSLSFSPDGRYLILTGQDVWRTTAGDNSAVMLLHNIADNHTIPVITRLPFFLPSVVYDWTEDGRWLAVAMEDGLVGLIAPDEGYAKLLPHGYGACTSVAWVQE